MFQSFPLHDRSSVNLRGEYHVENVTSFEDTAPQPDANGETMDVDTDADKAKDDKDSKDSKDSKAVTATATKAVSFDSKNKAASDEPLDPNALYPLFWSLQHSFSQPLSLFDQAQFTKFKEGMAATLTAFEKVDRLQKATKTNEESKTIPQKRKSPEAADERDGSNYNPKYLTSRDLFELEVSNRDMPTSLRRVLI